MKSVVNTKAILLTIASAIMVLAVITVITYRAKEVKAKEVVNNKSIKASMEASFDKAKYESAISFILSNESFSMDELIEFEGTEESKIVSGGLMEQLRLSAHEADTEDGEYASDPDESELIGDYDTDDLEVATEENEEIQDLDSEYEIDGAVEEAEDVDEGELYPIYDAYGNIRDYGEYEDYMRGMEEMAAAPQIVVLSANYFDRHINMVVNDKYYGELRVIALLNSEKEIERLEVM